MQSITAAMTAEQSGEQSREAEADLGDLWSAMNLYSCNYWFLGVDRAPEATESLGEPGGRQEGQSFTAEVKVLRPPTAPPPPEARCFLLTRFCAPRRWSR